MSRIPQIRSALTLSAADLGFVLLALAVGSLLALPAARCHCPLPLCPLSGSLGPRPHDCRRPSDVYSAPLL